MQRILNWLAWSIAVTSNPIIYLDTKSIRWWWWWDNFMQICTDFLSYAYVNQRNIYSKITVQLMMVEVKSTQNFGCNCAPLWILQSMRNKQTQDATLKTNANHTYFGIIFKCVRAYIYFKNIRWVTENTKLELEKMVLSNILRLISFKFPSEFKYLAWL